MDESVEEMIKKKDNLQKKANNLRKRRDELHKKLLANDLIVLTCGANTIRFRPPLIISSTEIDKALEIVDKTLKTF